MSPPGHLSAPTHASAERAGCSTCSRRHLLAATVAAAWPAARAEPGRDADLRWIAAAEQEKQRALGWGDQPYGAVLVRGERLIGLGPSRVVQRNDSQAHAERVAIADALQRHGTGTVAGSTLYSTSRPCRVCEAAAARAGVARLVFGADAHDGGTPRP